MGKKLNDVLRIANTTINTESANRANLVEGVALYVPKSEAFFMAETGTGKYAHILCAQIVGNEVIPIRVFMGQVCPTAYTDEGVAFKPYEDFSEEAKRFARYLRANTKAFFGEFGGQMVEVVDHTTCNRHTIENGKVVISGTREVYAFEVSKQKIDDRFTEWERGLLQEELPTPPKRTRAKK